MKKRETVYVYCDSCGKAELEEIDFSYGYAIELLPIGWSKVGKKHLCPICSEIYRKLKEEIEK